jgi:Amt family ammonium transporter
MPIDASDTTWIIVATGLVMIMTPALGFFEAGLLRSKNSLSVIMQTFSGLAILSALWLIMGFTMVYGTTQFGIIGGSDWVFFNGVPLEEAIPYAPTIPAITFASYVMMLAVVTPLLITGAIAERMKWSAFLILIIAWSIFVYYPLAHWVWNKGGWLAQLGVFDFAGGIVIHTSAGMSSLAAAIVLRRRKYFGTSLLLPHNIPLAVIGASLLWLGWFGFNAGSGFISGALASNVLLVTHIGSAMGAIVWMLLSWRRSGRASLTAVINGALVGLVAVTPSAAYWNRRRLDIIFCNDTFQRKIKD